ncbi:MAG TPA: S8 family serine peptidase [Thermoanaerobaculia bacterium]|jgi:serine protease
MRRQFSIALFSLLTAASLLAADTQPSVAGTQRYLVATRQVVTGESVTLRNRDAEPVVITRNVRTFRELGGFVADLTAAEVTALRLSADVRYVEPVIERYAYQVTTRRIGGQAVPYGIDSVRARDAWVGTKGENVNVVVVDTGVDFQHGDLGSVYAGGTNVIDPKALPMDDNGHGTHVAGTIAAADNSFGVVGIAPKVRLWAVKVLDANGQGSSASVVAGVDWAIARKRELGGRWILNFSLGSPRSSTFEREAFQRLADAGILAVAATGNDSSNLAAAPVGFPAGYPTVFAVGAIDSANKVASFSNQGPEIDVVAPGVTVLSTIPRGTGSIAYVSVNPSLTYIGQPLDGAKLGSISGELVFCGVGLPEEFPARVNGRIALIQRGGDITFALKTRRALQAGAIGVAIFNHDNSTMNWTLVNSGDPADVDFPWPLVVALRKEDGEALKSQRGVVELGHAVDDYGTLSGTSMATPHVAGVAALVWSAAPSATAQQVRDAIATTARDLGALGFDVTYGNGVVDALEAARTLAPSLFGSGATPQPPPGRGRGRAVGRP